MLPRTKQSGMHADRTRNADSGMVVIEELASSGRNVGASLKILPRSYKSGCSITVYPRGNTHTS